jgi:hypothetical protein
MLQMLKPMDLDKSRLSIDDSVISQINQTSSTLIPDAKQQKMGSNRNSSTMIGFNSNQNIVSTLLLHSNQPEPGDNEVHGQASLFH